MCIVYTNIIAHTVLSVCMCALLVHRRRRRRLRAHKMCVSIVRCRCRHKWSSIAAWRFGAAVYRKFLVHSSVHSSRMSLIPTANFAKFYTLYMLLLYQPLASCANKKPLFFVCCKTVKQLKNKCLKRHTSGTSGTNTATTTTDDDDQI